MSRHKILRFILAEWIAIVGWVLAIVGIYLSYYFAVYGAPRREPVYAVDPVRTRLLNSDDIGKTSIQILSPEGARIEGDVTSVRIYFWNRGREVVRASDVLEPIKILLDGPGVKIIDYRMERPCRDISALHVGKSPNAPNELNLSFDLLEENDGGSIQIVFAGTYDVPVRVLGSTINASTIRDVSTEIPLPTSLSQTWNFLSWFGSTMMAYFVLATAGTLVVLLVYQGSEWVLVRLIPPLKSTEFTVGRVSFATLTSVGVLFVSVWLLMQLPKQSGGDRDKMRSNQFIDPPSCIVPTT